MTGGRLAFYRRDGEAFVPTGIGVSPWNGTSQVGLALAGLSGHVIAAVPTQEPMLTTRISIDILGAVPLPKSPRIAASESGASGSPSTISVRNRIQIAPGPGRERSRSIWRSSNHLRSS